MDDQCFLCLWVVFCKVEIVTEVGPGSGKSFTGQIPGWLSRSPVDNMGRILGRPSNQTCLLEQCLCSSVDSVLFSFTEYCWVLLQSFFPKVFRCSSSQLLANHLTVASLSFLGDWQVAEPTGVFYNGESCFCPVQRGPCLPGVSPASAAGTRTFCCPPPL